MGKILIVDDNKEMRHKYRRLLEKMKLEVLEASDALEVVEVLMRNSRELDLILLDIQMPEVDGRGIHEIVSDYISSVPIVISSVLPVREQKLRIPRARDYFDKADGDQVFSKKVKAILGLSST